MTGPEHYREAQRLLRNLQRYTDASDALVIAAMAQVHATLAQAAAEVDHVEPKTAGR